MSTYLFLLKISLRKFTFAQVIYLYDLGILLLTQITCHKILFYRGERERGLFSLAANATMNSRYTNPGFNI